MLLFTFFNVASENLKSHMWLDLCFPSLLLLEDRLEVEVLPEFGQPNAAWSPSTRGKDRETMGRLEEGKPR